MLELLLALILSVHAARGPEAEHRERLESIARNMLDAAEKRQVFTGPEGVFATALALHAVAAHESGYWSKVQDCSVCFVGSPWCDRGRSVTIYQLQQGSGAFGEYTREELCEDNVLATERALVILRRHSAAASAVIMFSGYAGGRVRPNRAGREIGALFDTALLKAKLFVVFREGGLFADRYYR